jgi:hypothetical protein
MERRHPSGDGARVLFDGKRYRTLSEIAGRITGAHWSGPTFFGLTKLAKEADDCSGLSRVLRNSPRLQLPVKPDILRISIRVSLVP